MGTIWWRSYNGETSLNAVKREVREELGIRLNDDEIIYIGSYTRVKDIVDIWAVQKNILQDDIKLQKGEVSEIKKVTFKQFEEMLMSGEVVPTINPSYEILKRYYEVYMKGKLI